MNHDQKDLILKIIKSNALAALPLTVMCIIFWDIPTGLSLFLGAFMATAGFVGNVYVTRFILEGYSSAWLAVVIQIFRILIILTAAIVLIKIRATLILFFLAGYSLIFVGIYVYTKSLNKKP